MNEHMQAIQNVVQPAIYTMGISFILGSLFTVFILVTFDFMQQYRKNKNAKPI
jgi:hypothetical protein